jgi:DNA-binding PadR family transcriptional regulator
MCCSTTPTRPVNATGRLASPGTVYPTLNLLEDLGHAASTTHEGGRKQYCITPEGQEQIEQQRDALDRVLARLGQGKTLAGARRVPEVQRAMQNLKTALQLRFADGPQEVATVRRVAEIIDRAAVDSAARRAQQQCLVAGRDLVHAPLELAVVRSRCEAAPAAGSLVVVSKDGADGTENGLDGFHGVR